MNEKINYTAIEQKTFEQVQKKFAELRGMSKEEITRDSRLQEDLGMDSLDEVESVMTIEDLFGLEIPEEDAKKFNTVGDVVKWCSAEFAGRI